MDIGDEDLIRFWEALGQNHVQYIMVGGLAVVLYGSVRATADADLWIKDTIENRANLRKALFEYGLDDMPLIETMEFVPGWTTLFLYPGFELDLMTNLKFFTQTDFDKCYEISIKAEINNCIVPFLHINHLLQEKKANNRPKDLIDIEELEKIIALTQKDK